MFTSTAGTAAQAGRDWASGLRAREHCSVPSDMGHFRLVRDVIDRLSQLGATAAYLKQELRDKLLGYRESVEAHGQGMLEVRHWD